MHNHRYRQFGMKDGKFSPHNRTLWSMKKPRHRAFLFCWVFSVCALGFSSGSRFEQTSARIRLPDDCTVGFIVEKRLGVSMVHCPLFHSHLENLLLVSQRSIPNQVVTHRTHTHTDVHTDTLLLMCVCSLLQVTLSYGMFENKMNSIEVKGSFSKEDDPSRFVHHLMNVEI